MSRFRLRPKAIEDLEAIGDHIAADNPAHAVSFVRELKDLCARIATRPRAFRRRDDLCPLVLALCPLVLAAGLRQAVHGRYLVLFTVDDDGVVIERVAHGARRLEDLL